MSRDPHPNHWNEAEFPDDAHARWLEKWAPECPIGLPQRVAVCLGQREREPGRLQLRVAMCGGEGICETIVEEAEDTVRVRVLLCYDEERVAEYGKREYVNCPVHVYLESPLAGRTVIDVQTDEPVPLFVPDWE